MFYHTNLQKLEDLKQTLVDLEGEDKENFDIIQDQPMFQFTEDLYSKDFQELELSNLKNEPNTIIELPKDVVL